LQGRKRACSHDLICHPLDSDVSNTDTLSYSDTDNLPFLIPGDESNSESDSDGSDFDRSDQFEAVAASSSTDVQA